MLLEVVVSHKLKLESLADGNNNSCWANHNELEKDPAVSNCAMTGQSLHTTQGTALSSQSRGEIYAEAGLHGLLPCRRTSADFT